ncbi:SMP-30/gluconolactonase/LRE family protein [Streptomyces sp. NPDC049040]|uniref:SMP-30/gluconolactonase/LRE family protein n=1 Tax=Streptomyces sp. NPDC049040 TaxID=3365593 RepID=UPI00371BB870
MTLLRRIPLPGTGPEDVVADSEGTLYTGLDDGSILAVDVEAATVRSVAHTGGRPLGLHPLPDGRLLVCDAQRGLLRLDPDSGRIDTLLTEVRGERLTCCSNAATAADGTTYVSDSSRRFSLDHWKGDLLEHSGTGRLIRLPPGGEPEVILDGLQFANRVTLAADGSFVTVAETGGYRLRRVHLTGPRAGQADVLTDNLPGFPDNLSTGSDGLIWIAMAAPRDPLLDRLHRFHPVLRKAIWRVPPRFQPDARPTAWALAVDVEGRVVHDMQRGDLHYRMVTSACAVGGRLYLGSLVENALLEIALPS